MKKLCAVLVLLAVVPFSGASQVDYFLKIDGIDGEATAKGWEKHTEVSAFAWVISNTGSPATLAGKVNVHDLSVTKSCDRTSPKLMLACANGERIRRALLTVRTAGREGESDVYVRYTMQDVIITGYSVKGTASGVAEELTLGFMAESVDFDLREGA
jgi:type VI secretion system secreted protein Hcp